MHDPCSHDSRGIGVDPQWSAKASLWASAPARNRLPPMAPARPHRWRSLGSARPMTGRGRRCSGPAPIQTAHRGRWRPRASPRMRFGPLGGVGFRLGHQLPGALQLPVEHGGPDAAPAPFGVDAAEEIGAVLALGARPVPDLGPCDHRALVIDGKAESDSGSKKGASYSETTSSNCVTIGSLSLTSLRRITPWTSGRSSGVMGRNSMPSGISMSRSRLTGRGHARSCISGAMWSG